MRARSRTSRRGVEDRQGRCACAGRAVPPPAGPVLWVPTLEKHELRELLRRRMHLVRLRTSAINRTFGLCTQWGLQFGLERLREPGAQELLERHGMPAVWRGSIAEALALIDLLDARNRPARARALATRALRSAGATAQTIPGVGRLLGLTIANEIGDVARFHGARRLIGFNVENPPLPPHAGLSRRFRGFRQRASSATVDDNLFELGLARVTHQSRR